MNGRGRLFYEGLVIGLLGYFTVAAVFGLMNLVAGRSIFYTASLLGASLVREATGYRPVVAYNAVHALAFVILGLSVAWLVYETERHPQFWFFIFLVSVAGFMMTFLIFFLIAEPVTAAIPWWEFIVANLAAALVIGLYLFRTHETLWKRVAEQPDEIL